MAYLLKWLSKEGIRTVLSFDRKPEAIAQATAAIDTGATDVELLENGKPVPRGEWAPARPAKGRRRAPA